VCIWSAKKYGTGLDNLYCTLFDLETGYGPDKIGSKGHDKN
jgi:hypothetical protein